MFNRVVPGRPMSRSRGWILRAEAPAARGPVADFPAFSAVTDPQSSPARGPRGTLCDPISGGIHTVHVLPSLDAEARAAPR